MVASFPYEAFNCHRSLLSVLLSLIDDERRSSEYDGLTENARREKDGPSRMA